MFRVHGDVDSSTIAPFREALACAARNAAAAIIIALDVCPYIDSTGLNARIHAQKASSARLRLVVPPSGVVAPLCAIAGLDTFLNVKSSIVDALTPSVA